MTRKSRPEASSGYTILLVDDNAEYLEMTRRILEREGHTVLAAANGPEALNLLRRNAVDLLLLDYFMPGMTGEEVVVQLRQFNPFVQVILQTGYASEQPPRELLRRLDIQGYHDKSEGPDKLLMWVDVGLKVAYTVQLLYKSRQGLRYILDITPDLHKIQPLRDLLKGILLQISGLMGAADAFLAVLPENESASEEVQQTESFLAMLEDDADLNIRAGTGRFDGLAKVENCLEFQAIQKVWDALQQGEVKSLNGATIVPLRVGGLTIGVIYLDRLVRTERDLELLLIFANQAAVAIHNTQLYEMAALDPLTGVQVRRFFEQWLLREMRTAFRLRQPLALLMIDIDFMKRINDTAGHLTGDQALTILGKVLLQATRSSDVVARYGGDEFSIVLPQTSMEGAQRVAQRILDSLSDKSVAGPDGPLPIRVSLGISSINERSFPNQDIPRPVPQAYFQLVSQDLIQKADKALYQAKHDGGNQACQGVMAAWQPFSDRPPEQPAVIGTGLTS